MSGELGGVKRFRSPPYPYLSLGKAIERATQLFQKAQHHPVGLNVLANAWGMSHLSGSLLKSAAALIQYGLIKDHGSGDGRKFQLTDAARRILQDADQASEKRKSLIKTTALAPSIHRELWDKFGAANQLSDALLKNHLLFDRTEIGEAPFSDNSADEVIQTYREAILFAGLDQTPENGGLDSGKSENDVNSSLPIDRNNSMAIGLGDLIQWDLNGVLQFGKPRRVRWISDDNNWIAVEGSNTGIPANEVIIESKSSARDIPLEIAPTVANLNASATDTPAKEWIRTSLGSHTSVEIYATGSMGPKEIGKLIKLLEVQKSVLEED